MQRAIVSRSLVPKTAHCRSSQSAGNRRSFHWQPALVPATFITPSHQDTRGQTPRNDLFAGPLRLRAAEADRTRTGTDPDVATDSDCASLLAVDLDVIRMFTSLSAANYTKNLFICGRIFAPKFFFRTENTRHNGQNERTKNGQHDFCQAKHSFPRNNKRFLHVHLFHLPSQCRLRSPPTHAVELLI